jgi:hypothetical protein
MRFVPVSALSAGSPVLHSDLLTRWPKNQSTVVGFNDEVMAVFDGPRVLFPDGFSKQEHTVRAVYYDGPAAFTHSIGVIAGPPADATLLQFAAVYLRSRLARYFLMMRGWKMLCERNGVHLSDVQAFPFFDVEAAPDPKAASVALTKVARAMRGLAQLPELQQSRRYAAIQSELDEEVFKYFGLSESEQTLVSETVDILMPSIRPRSFKSLDTPAQAAAQPADFRLYSEALAGSLTKWRERTGGGGWFDVKVVAGDPRREGPAGIVRISYKNEFTAPATASAELNDDLVLMTLARLRTAGLTAIASGDALQLVPDAHVWTDGSLYLVRPLSRRSWTIRQALRDAERIVRSAQGRPQVASRPEVA